MGSERAASSSQLKFAAEEVLRTINPDAASSEDDGGGVVRRRGQDGGQNGGQENNRPKDRAEDRAEDRTWDRTENSAGQEQNLLGLPLQGGHEEAVRSPAVVQGRVHLGNRVERTENKTEDRMEDR